MAIVPNAGIHIILPPATSDRESVQLDTLLEEYGVRKVLDIVEAAQLLSGVMNGHAPPPPVSAETLPAETDIPAADAAVGTPGGRNGRRTRRAPVCGQVTKSGSICQTPASVCRHHQPKADTGGAPDAVSAPVAAPETPPLAKDAELPDQPETDTAEPIRMTAPAAETDIARCPKCGSKGGSIRTEPNEDNTGWQRKCYPCGFTIQLDEV